MFFQSTNLKRKAYVLLTMHKTIRGEFEKQLRAGLSVESLSVQQQGEIAMLLIFPVLKSIEKATASKSSFAELSNHFLDHLFSNEGGYGLDESIKGYVLPNLNRLGEYENTDMEEIHSLFYEKIDSPHSSNNAEMAEIVQMNFVITAKEAKKIIDK